MEGTEPEVAVPRSTPPPSRVLYIVARNRLDVYFALLEAFVESSRLGIVLDRRDEPSAATALPADRRRLLLDDALRTHGWARVRIDSDGQTILIDPHLASKGPEWQSC